MCAMNLDKHCMWSFNQVWFMYITQVNENGVISFRRSFSTFTPRLFSQVDQMIIAPYWADVDIRRTGNIYYRQTTDPSLLARATSEIRAVFPESLNVSSLLIATWNRVGYYNQHTDKVCMMCIICYIFRLSTLSFQILSIISFFYLSDLGCAKTRNGTNRGARKIENLYLNSCTLLIIVYSN